MLQVTHQKAKNIIMTNLEWTGTKFEEVPLEAQLIAKVKMTEAMASFGCNLSNKEADHIRENLEL